MTLQMFLNTETTATQLIFKDYLQAKPIIIGNSVPIMATK